MGFFVASRQTVELDVFLRSFVVYAQIARHHVRVDSPPGVLEHVLDAPSAPLGTGSEPADNVIEIDRLPLPTFVPPRLAVFASVVAALIHHGAGDVVADVAARAVRIPLLAVRHMPYVLSCGALPHAILKMRQHCENAARFTCLYEWVGPDGGTMGCAR